MINDRTTVASCCAFRRKDLGRRARHSIVSTGDGRQECGYCGGAFRSASGRSAGERAHYLGGERTWCRRRRPTLVATQPPGPSSATPPNWVMPKNNGRVQSGRMIRGILQTAYHAGKLQIKKYTYIIEPVYHNANLYTCPSLCVT